MDGMKREDAVLARLEAEIAAIEEEIRRTERYLRMNAGRPAEDLVVGVKNAFTTYAGAARRSGENCGSCSSQT